jgi:hypothetical protein
MIRLRDIGCRSVRRRTYPVRGVNLDEISESIDANTTVEGGKAGQTSLSFESEEKRTTLFGGITVDREIVLDYTIETLLPELSRGGVPPAVQVQYDRFYSNLCLHEANHARIYFAAIDLMISVKDPKKFGLIYSESNKIQDEYDRISNHGILEGTVLGPPTEVHDFSKWVSEAIRSLTELSGAGYGPRPVPVVSMKYCRYCGHRIAPLAIFCRSCGRRLSASLARP